MEKYVYLLLGTSLAAVLAVALLFRKDLTNKVLKIGMFGGAAGLVAELFYFRDYWRPPTLRGIAVISIEDFLFGFMITALSFVTYPLLCKRSFGGRTFPRRIRLYGLFFLIGLAAILVCNLWLGVNSIFVTSIAFIIFAGMMVGMRPDLLRPAVVAVGAVMTIVLAVYLVLFNILAPTYWDNYWLLADTSWGVTIFGNLPLTEFIWYASWILFASISYPFASGKRFILRPESTGSKS